MPDEPAVSTTPAPLEETGTGWTLYAPEGQKTVEDWNGLADVIYEVLPDNDLVDHTTDGDCICDPDMIASGKSPAGYILWVALHSSADGRELAEHDHDPAEIEALGQMWPDARPKVIIRTNAQTPPDLRTAPNLRWLIVMTHAIWFAPFTIWKRLRLLGALVMHYLRRRSIETF
jgi:hypothetical protein